MREVKNQTKINTQPKEEQNSMEYKRTQKRN
jgi:hypothetical protein